MTIQENFDQFITFLRPHAEDNPIVRELLSHCLIVELTYHPCYFSAPNKLDILEIYEGRAEFEEDRQGEKFVLGYERLLPSLRETRQDSIGISSITSDHGSYMTFSDPEKTEFIGILKSNRTLSQIRSMYHNHQQLVEQTGKKFIPDYDEDGTIFVNGKLVE